MVTALGATANGQSQGSGSTTDAHTTKGTTVKGWVMVLIVAGALAVGACGGGGKEYGSASEVAKAAGCTGFAAQEAQMFTQETGSCTIDGKEVYVMTFADEDARANWVKAAKAAGASGFFGEGGKWVIQSDDKAAVEKGAKAAGGELA